MSGQGQNTPASLGYANVSLYRAGEQRGFAGFEGQNGTFSFNLRNVKFDAPANVKVGDRLVVDRVQAGQDGVLLTIHAS